MNHAFSAGSIARHVIQRVTTVLRMPPLVPLFKCSKIKEFLTKWCCSTHGVCTHLIRVSLRTLARILVYSSPDPEATSVHRLSLLIHSLLARDLINVWLFVQYDGDLKVTPYRHNSSIYLIFIYSNYKLSYLTIKQRQWKVRSLPRAPTNCHCLDSNPRPFNQHDWVWYLYQLGHLLLSLHCWCHK